MSPRNPRSRGRLVALASCTVLARCAAPAPVPVVAVAPVAPLAPASVTPTSPPPTDTPTAESAAAAPCADEREAARRATDHPSTMEDCGRVWQTTDDLARCLQGPETDPAERSREALGARAECADAVATADYQTLAASLTAKDSARHLAAIRALRLTVSGFCTRCDPIWGLACVGSVFDWVDERVRAAASGSVVVEVKPEASAGKRSPPTVPAKRAAGKGASALATSFGELATAICALPPSAWKEHHAPTGCAVRAIASLRQAMPPFPGRASDRATCDLDAPGP